MDSTKKPKNSDAKTPIKSFKDLIVWQRVNQLVLNIFEITQDFPTDEQLGITLQIRKAAISASINIAQGFTNRKDNLYFYETSSINLKEVDCLIFLSNELGYITEKDQSNLSELCEDCSKLLWGWTKAISK